MHHNEEDEDEENEATENATEEVMMLRQRDESQVIKYTPEAEKKTRPKLTPQNLIQRIKTVKLRGTIGSVAQNLFDLYTIEIPPSWLETVSMHTKFQENLFLRYVKVCPHE